MYDSLLYLFKNKKIIPSYHNFELYLDNPKNINHSLILNTEFYLDFFDADICKPDYKWLVKACEKGSIQIISNILMNKNTPTKTCYELLFLNEVLRGNFHEKGCDYIDSKYSKNILLNEVIDLFIQFSYNITNDDIITATKYGVILNPSISTRNFIPNDEFFGCCNENFFPIYNDNYKKN